MIRSFPDRPRFLLVLAVLALALVGGTGGARAGAASAPTLTDVSATTQAPTLFTVAGTGFTPGGAVYLAVYDQMGAKLYETRWVTASPTATALHHEPGDGRTGGYAVTTPSGALREGFAHLCGADAMMRALDERTATWSNWLPVRFACAGDDPHPTGHPS